LDEFLNRVFFTLHKDVDGAVSLVPDVPGQAEVLSQLLDVPP